MKMRVLAIALALTVLSGCSSLSALNPFSSDDKPPKLQPITASATARVLWQGSVGKAGLYVFTPAVVGSTVYAAAGNGSIMRIDAGRVAWKINAGQPLSGGVGADDNLVVVGTPKGEILAFAAADGALRWKAHATSAVLAPPALGDGLVVVRSADNRLTAYDAADGKRKWIYQRPMPALALRSTAGVLIDGSYVFAGFPGGKLVAVSTSNGAAVWEGTVAVPKGVTELDRIADITSLPVISNGTVCAVAFQGRVACFELGNGSQMWTRDVSSAVGLTIDDRQLYVTDDKDAVHAFDLSSGASLWKQSRLAKRRLSAPIARGDKVAVADAEGVVHFLSRADGAFAARLVTDGSAIIAAPQALGANMVLQTRGGGVFAVEVE